MEAKQGILARHARALRRTEARRAASASADLFFGVTMLSSTSTASVVVSERAQNKYEKTKEKEEK